MVGSKAIGSRAADMWNITSSELELAREELKGRRAAVEARYAKDLQGLDADLAEIETLERAAAAFALKHKTEAEQGMATTEPEVESKTASEKPPGAALDRKPLSYTNSFDNTASI